MFCRAERAPAFPAAAVLPLLLCALLTASGAQARERLDSVRMHESPDYTRVVLDVSAPVRFELFTLENPRRVVIDLADTAPAPGFDARAAAAGRKRVSAVRTSVRGSDFRVVLDVTGPVEPKGFALDPVAPYGHRLVVDLYGEEREKAVSKVTYRPNGRRDVIIAVDAGHGGEDPGASGPGGAIEKHVVMQIAQRLARKLERAEGYAPVMVRTGDYYLAHRKRIQVARDARADLFVSIHADAFKLPSVYGASVYTLSDKGASSETARWLAKEHENSDLIGGEEDVDLGARDDEVVKLIISLSMDANRVASIDVGQEILKNLRPVTRLHKKRVEQAGFLVLKSPDIPSILVETGFISNPDEARRLKTSAFQEKVADAIFAGIRNYMSARAPDGTLIAYRRDHGEQRYTITRGDTLSGIAVRYGTSARRLREANGISGDKIRVGQVIKIPAG
jgi:N-acetylmuramoyl-L-alanine amidase